MVLQQKKENLLDSQKKCSFCGKGYLAENRTNTLKYTFSGEEKSITSISRFCSEFCETEYEEKIRLEDQKKLLDTRLYTVPDKFLNIKTDRLDLLEEHIDDSLYITGGVGVGKSVFAANLAEALAIKHKTTITWINYTSFLFDIKQLFKLASEDPYDRVKKIAKSNILFIDDFGTEKITDFIQEITYYLINEREINNLRTIITSNIDIENIEARIASRIAGICELIELSGEDRRIKR